MYNDMTKTEKMLECLKEAKSIIKHHHHRSPYLASNYTTNWIKRATDLININTHGNN